MLQATSDVVCLIHTQEDRMESKSVRIDQKTYEAARALAKARRQTFKVIISEAVKLLSERFSTEAVSAK